MRTLDDRPHRVYRCYDADDSLIYIGCTVTSVKRRLLTHRRAHPEVAERTVRWTEEEYPDRVSALTAEARAIYFERPQLNFHHNGDVHPRAGTMVPLTPEESWARLRAVIHRLGAPADPAP